MTWQTVVKGVLVGFGQGTVAAGLGYLKQKEKFNPKKFFQTVAVGGIVGGVGGGLGMNYEDAAVHLESIGVITLIEYAKKAVWNRIKDWRPLESA